jgi:SAM-dependent methyltransferase
MTTPHRTWHYGLMARWWAEFVEGGADVEYFQSLIEQNGQPALDLGCGTGRLLAQFRRSGLDVDGCDISEDMIARCREQFGDDPGAQLYVQATNELERPRRYQTVIICGSFGIGGTRRDDMEGLRRIHQHLLPGGLLAFDLYIPNVNDKIWRTWLNENRPMLPSPWSRRGDRRRCEDGTELEMKGRVLDFDPLNQVSTRGVKIDHWRAMNSSPARRVRFR